MRIFELMKNYTEETITKCINLLGVNDLPLADQEICLDEITKYVFNTNERHSSGKQTFDLNEDYKYYFVDFLKLGINLNKNEIDWWEFDSILEGIFLDENSTMSKVMNYRLYEKPPKNVKVQEEQEHKFKMKMKEKYSLHIKSNPNEGLEKLWNYVKTKAGDKCKD